MAKSAGQRDTKPTVSLTFRLPLGLMEKIKEDFDSTDDFPSISSWVNAACREFVVIRAEQRSKLERVSEQSRRGGGGSVN